MLIDFRDMLSCRIHGNEEFLYDDIKYKTGKEKEGYRKIKKCCEIAAADGLDYIWIDTCCIDKSSSAELSEAINSMFRWYLESDVCYTYLFDIETFGVPDGLVSLRQLRHSRWISPGWTLQELIAPRTVRFFSRHWTECGDRETLGPSLSQITNIDLDILQRSSIDNELDLIYSLSIAKRMSWAATRQTTRPEDAAYCLLGLFNVNMVMLYGEGGSRAFHRLQEEIMKYSTDQTILAWTPPMQNWTNTRVPVLADSPSAFHDGSRIRPFEEGHYFEMTSRGLQLPSRLFDLAVIPFRSKKEEPPKRLQLKVIMLSCFYEDDPSGQLGLIVGQVKGEGNSGLRFARAMQCPVIIPLKQVELWFSTHMPDGTPVLPPPQFNFVGSESSGPKVEEYLKAVQRVVEQPKIYIAYVITQSRSRDMDNAYYVLTLSITIKSHKRKRNFSLVTSSLNTTLQAGELVGTVGEQDVEVHLTEQYGNGMTGLDPILCRAIFSRRTIYSRSSADEENYMLKVELRCSCGRKCGQQDPTNLGSGEYIECEGYRIRVSVTLREEQRPGRKYNLINFDISYWRLRKN